MKCCEHVAWGMLVLLSGCDCGGAASSPDGPLPGADADEAGDSRDADDGEGRTDDVRLDTPSPDGDAEPDVDDDDAAGDVDAADADDDVDDSTTGEDGADDDAPDAEASGCTAPPECPPALAGHSSLCGRLFDLEDTTPIDDGIVATGEPAAALEVRIWVTTELLTDPGIPVPRATVPVDSCGYYVAANIPTHPTALFAVSTDDRPGLPDEHVHTAIMFSVPAGTTLATAHAWVLRRATDVAWTAAAGLSGGSFAAQGTYLGLFLDPRTPTVAPLPGTPVAGVRILINGVEPRRGERFDFDDVDPLLRRMPDVRPAETGANGAVLAVAAADSVGYTGFGGVPAGCSTWTAYIGATATDIVLVQYFTAICP
jgi:hypothetical protein